LSRWNGRAAAICRGTLLLAIAGCAARPVVPDPPAPVPVSQAPARTIEEPRGVPVTPFGSYSRVEVIGDHANGYAVQLWRCGESVVGLLLGYVGDTAEPPTGVLEDVRYGDSGEFSFRARLSLGSMSGKGGTERPTRDRFTFRGTLSESAVSGVLEIEDPLNSGVPPRREMIALRRDEEAVLEPATDLGEWRRQVDEILRTRGPGW